ncbi:hypothetical protein B1H10_07580 [candidate division KSB1 bacterium 4484_188]|nr:MAG: hypothetical protein B1H10_07580 [candidate division KSB1 bacterium 4484_188]HFE64253.1 DUF4876 domain-containing protein [Caldithrix sp.]
MQLFKAKNMLTGKIKISCILLFLLSMLYFQRCTEEITYPESVQFSSTVHIVDSSYVTKGIYGSTDVPGALVNLSGTSTGLRFSAKTDRRGIATFSHLLPDFYNCDVQRVYPEDTVLQFLGVAKEAVVVGSKAVQKMSRAADSFFVALKMVARTPFVLSEIYYNGAPPPPPLYFHDQFTEIYNNSQDTVYIDGYAIGDVDYGYLDDPDFVYCIHLYEFPGNGTDYPVAPGGTVIVAQDAEDHTMKNPKSLDLSNADFEYYNPLSSDIDNPFVPNMIQIHHKYGFDFLYSVMNDAIVLFKLEEGDTLGYGPFNLIKVPKAWVVDGVEYKEDLGNLEFKRLSDDIDAGLTGGIPSYQGKSVARKVFKIIDGQKVLSDHNNSFIDFQVLDIPSPGSIE